MRILTIYYSKVIKEAITLISGILELVGTSVPIQKWPFPVLRILWTKKYQLLDVLRNAVRILAEQWPFQLQQAFHEIWFLPKNCTKCVYFALKSHFLTISGPRLSFPVKLPVTSGSVWDRCLESIRVPRCSGASELDKCAHVTFATQKKEA